MAYDFNPLKKRIDEVKTWLAGELTGVRTGRATAAILDSITVSSYGSQSPIAHVAAIATQDARSLMITPWDKGQMKDIEKAINDADLGLSVSASDTGVRVTFPELTSDRRASLVKIVGGKLEEAKISLRKEREAVWNDIQKKEKDGEMSEDDKFRSKDGMQKLVDEGASALEAIASKKEQELMS